MKFAKELEADLVPEWRVKYLDYKASGSSCRKSGLFLLTKGHLQLGKKKIKAVSRAITNAHKSPRTPFQKTPVWKSPSKSTTPKLFNANRSETKQPALSQGSSNSSDEEEDIRLNNPVIQRSLEGLAALTPAMPIPAARERQPLNRQEGEHLNRQGFTRYGSIIGSPPSPELKLSRPATLNIGEPALESASSLSRQASHTSNKHRPDLKERRTRSANSTLISASTNAFEVGKTKHPFTGHFSASKRAVSFLHSKRHTDAERPLLKRIFSSKVPTLTVSQAGDVPLGALQEIDAKQDEFFSFLDKELDKVETFYISKEQEAAERLNILRQQLHVMRDKRMEEINSFRQRREQRKRLNAISHVAAEPNEDGSRLMPRVSHLPDIQHSLDVIYHPIRAARQVHFGQRTPHINQLATPPMHPDHPDHSKDYVRRHNRGEVPYLTAKRKLKTALQEFYRGLELLKSYALLNRTGFRKINKKYDKTVRARPTMRYMNEKVNDAYFVQSSSLDSYITAVEDLYARYFEKGSHKIAVNKLRKKNRQVGIYTGSVFRNGFFAASGLVFGIQGLVAAKNLLFSNDTVLNTQTSYLLQLYAGYFLLLFLMIFFCVDCMIFSQSKVNYTFIFEFDTRHNLDWRQLSELPCFFLFVLGLILWLNFMEIGGVTMYLWYPVILIGFTALVLILPAPILYHESRRWLLYSLSRLFFCAGLVPVEFRDFFLGDMFCSQTYAMGNVELFFCLYAHFWSNEQQCNSTHSRLLGFFTALPGIWRLLQCLRRYKDTKNVFPHLVNGGKYTFTILAATSLSMYRIDRSAGMKAFFITCSLINSIYCSIWDILMDWSLLDPTAEHYLLRHNLAYKHTSTYYVAMPIDVILRHNWIFYAIFSNDLQHSAILSFFVGLSEICRRGIWTLFRVENEHCTNVGRFRASRDVPLPYKLHQDEEEDGEDVAAEEERDKDRNAIAEAGGMPASDLDFPDRAAKTFDKRPATATGADVEGQHLSGQPSPEVSSLRRRQSAAPALATIVGIRSRVGNILRRAHAQDFERKRPSKDDPSRDVNEESDDDDSADDGADDGGDDGGDDAGHGNGGVGMDEEDLAVEAREDARKRQEARNQGSSSRGS